MHKEAYVNKTEEIDIYMLQNMDFCIIPEMGRTTGQVEREGNFVRGEVFIRQDKGWRAPTPVTASLYNIYKEIGMQPYNHTLAIYYIETCFEVPDIEYTANLKIVDES